MPHKLVDHFPRRRRRRHSRAAGLERWLRDFAIALEA